MNYFQVSGDRKLRASFGNDQVAALTDHFSSPLSNDEKESAVLQWQELKIYPFNHQTMKPFDFYNTLLSSTPDSLKDILVLAELMLGSLPPQPNVRSAFQL